MSGSVKRIRESFKVYGHVKTNLPDPHEWGSYRSESMHTVACEAACSWDLNWDWNPDWGPKPAGEEENKVSSTAKHLEVEAMKHSYDPGGDTNPSNHPRKRDTVAEATAYYIFKPVTDRISLDFEGQVGLHGDSNFVRFSLRKSPDEPFFRSLILKEWPEADPVGDETIHEQNFVCDNLVAGEEHCIELFAKVSADDQTDARSYLKVTFSDDRPVPVTPVSVRFDE